MTDRFRSSASKDVIIHIEDINEPPMFLIRSVNVILYEGEFGTQVLGDDITEIVFDPDITDLLQFRILKGIHSELFYIDSDTGHISFGVDYDVDPSRYPGDVSLSVEVSDKGGLGDVLQVNLVILNVNSPPVVHAPTTLTVAENVPGGHLLFTVKTSDRDTADNVTVTTACLTATCCRYLDIQQTEGKSVVRVKQNHSLDYEEHFEMNCQQNSSLDGKTTINSTQNAVCIFSTHAYDGRVSSGEKIVTMFITDVDEAPVTFKTNVYVNVNEGKSGYVLPLEYVNLMYDPENESLMYSIETNDSTVGINLQNQTLILLKDIEKPQGQETVVHTFKIVGQDPAGQEAKAVVHLLFRFENEAPRFLNLPAHVTVLEKIATDDVIHHVLVSDDSRDVTMWYHVVTADDVMEGRLSLNTSSGHVVMSSYPPLAPGVRLHASVIVTAFDGSLASRHGVLDVTVVGVNDAPSFPPARRSLTVNESQTAEPLALPSHWKAVDPDQEADLDYHINNTYIQIEGFTLIFPSDFDIDKADTPSFFSFVLVASDLLGLTASVTATLIVTDVNDNSPLVINAEETVFLSRYSPLGTLVTQINATDIDSGKNAELLYRFNCEGENYSHGLFVVTQNGSVLLSAVLLQDMHRIHLCVAVSDLGYPPRTTEAWFNIVITNASTWISPSLEHESLKNNQEEKHNSSVYVSAVASVSLLLSVFLICFLSYKLWKNRLIVRRLSQSRGNAQHEYQFEWVPSRVCEFDRISHQSTTPEFQTIVFNDNFTFDGRIADSAPEQNTSVQQGKAFETCETDKDQSSSLLEDSIRERPVSVCNEKDLNLRKLWRPHPFASLLSLNQEAGTRKVDPSPASLIHTTQNHDLLLHSSIVVAADSRGLESKVIGDSHHVSVREGDIGSVRDISWRENKHMPEL